MGSRISSAASAPVSSGPKPLISVALTAVVRRSPRYSVGVKTVTPLRAIATSSQPSRPRRRSSGGRRCSRASRHSEATVNRAAASVSGPMSSRR